MFTCVIGGLITKAICVVCRAQEFREKDASIIEIPNIGYETFTAMMRYIYVGTVEVQQEQALPLLQVSQFVTKVALTLIPVCCCSAEGSRHCPS